MVDSHNLTVVTAIRSAESENFIASTLFNQGWSVTYRALDCDSLLTFLQASPSPRPLVFIATDLEGLNPDSLQQLQAMGVKYFLIAALQSDFEIYPEAVHQPTEALELLALIRGSLRTPLIRSTTPKKARARTIAIAATTGGIGCTTLALNLGAELSLFEKKVLIVDAHPHAPALATLLGERGLNTSGEFRKIAQNLSAIEFTHENISQNILALDQALHDFDFIIIDAGIIRELSSTLTGRRWEGEALIWATLHAEQIWFMGTSNVLGVERTRKLAGELALNPMKAKLVFLHSSRSQMKRKNPSDEGYLKVVTSLRPERIMQYPFDARGATAAHEEKCALYQSNERGLLRKFIAEIAGELAS